MSFLIENLSRVSASYNTVAPATFNYFHETDDLATITAADYFEVQKVSLRVRDIINIQASDNNGKFVVAQITPELTLSDFGDEFITGINTSNLKITNGILNTIQDINISASPTWNTVIASHMGVGTAGPATSAVLELFATDRALLITRMTTAQRDAIATPVDGMIIYNTTTTAFNGRAAGAWVAL